VSAPHAVDPARRRHLRRPASLRFPVEAEMPETRRHLEQRTALFEIVRDAFGDRATVGSEQFIYWDPTDPKQCCAPDLFVRLGAPDARFESWKVWERGAPELVVEITSPSDSGQGPWDEKLARFRRLGAREVVRFDSDERGRPLRIWDAIDGDLVERDPVDPAFLRCDTLGVFFCIRDDAEHEPMLRLARDLEGRELLPTPRERVSELEAELATRRNP
jgi:hypothetical protein